MKNRLRRKRNRLRSCRGRLEGDERASEDACVQS
jgi:hypothetical protein